MPRRAGPALNYLRDAIAVARDLGARVIAGPLYAPPWWFTGSRATEEQRRWAAEGFHALGPELDATGIDMAIEPMNRYETFFLNTAADGVALCEAVDHPRIGLLLDAAHMAIEEKDPVAAIQEAGPWLKHLHLSESDRGTPGTGRIIDWIALFAALARIGYRGGCAIESFPFADPAMAFKTRSWRDFAASADDLARDGLAFLRRARSASLQPSEGDHAHDGEDGEHTRP